MAWNKYQQQKKQVTTDGGLTWNDVIPYEYRKGSLLEANSPDCTPSDPDCDIQYKWVDVPTSEETMCWDGNEWSIQKKYYSRDCGASWIYSGVKQTYQLYQPNSECCDGNTYICGEPEPITVNYLSSSSVELIIPTNGETLQRPFVSPIFVGLYDPDATNIDIRYTLKYRYTGNPTFVTGTGGSIDWENHHKNYTQWRRSSSLVPTFSIYPNTTNIADETWQGIQMAWTSQSDETWAFPSKSYGNNVSAGNVSTLQYNDILSGNYTNYFDFRLRNNHVTFKSEDVTGTVTIPTEYQNMGYTWVQKHTMIENRISWIYDNVNNVMDMLPIVFNYNAPDCVLGFNGNVNVPNELIVKWHNKFYRWMKSSLQWSEVTEVEVNSNYVIQYGGYSGGTALPMIYETHFTYGNCSQGGGEVEPDITFEPVTPIADPMVWGVTNCGQLINSSSDVTVDGKTFLSEMKLRQNIKWKAGTHRVQYGSSFVEFTIPNDYTGYGLEGITEITKMVSYKFDASNAFYKCTNINSYYAMVDDWTSFNYFDGVQCSINNLYLKLTPCGVVNENPNSKSGGTRDVNKCYSGIIYGSSLTHVNNVYILDNDQWFEVCNIKDGKVGSYSTSFGLAFEDYRSLPLDQFYTKEHELLDAKIKQGTLETRGDSYATNSYLQYYSQSYDKLYYKDTAYGFYINKSS